MSLAIFFVLLLIGSFALLMYLLRPAKNEAALRQQLRDIKDSRGREVEDSPILKLEGYSRSPGFSRIIREIPGAYDTLQLIRESGRDWPVSHVMGVALAGAVLAGWVGTVVLPGPIVWLLAALVAGSLPYVLLLIMREARFRKCDKLLPEAIDLMARGLRAGHALNAVIEMVSREMNDPLASEFRRLHEEYVLGIPLRDAVINLVSRLPRDDMRFLASAILLQKETGGNLAAILDKTAFVARERARLRGQLKIYTAQGRITGWILCSMPFLMFGILSLANWGYERSLFTAPTGRKLVYAGVLTMSLGILAIRKIIDVRV